MFTVAGYLNGVSYAVQVGVSPARANDGVVAGSPQVIGLLKTREGMPMRPGRGLRAVSVDATTNNPAWVLACLHSETEVTDVDGTGIPDLGDRRPRKPQPAAPTPPAAVPGTVLPPTVPPPAPPAPVA